MDKCNRCESDEVVHSGVDAFILGINTGEYCYPCANRLMREKSEAGL
jgi:hypothetical protein